MDLAKAVTAAPDRFGMSGGPVRVRRLGAGETYEAWHVHAGAEDVVVRIVHRPVAELPRPMAAEFDMLRLVPDGFGPRPVLLDETTDLLGRPFMVTTFVPGSIVPPDRWTPELLTTHARRLAHLHGSSRPGGTRVADHFRDSLAWWTGHHPEIVAQVTHLVPLVAAFVEPTPPAPRHTLVHGDAVVTNILVDDAGTPRYIDWEWTGFGDPAQDLALLGGPIAVAPWYVPLGPAALDHFLAAYRTVHDDETLPVRRAAWEVCDRFFTSLHYRRQPHHHDVAAQLTTAVERVVGHGHGTDS
ncbi:phosphotransferase family protein [Actinophytocola sp.]|uniref:phosphotransferase family protein n=1 Tax=Actinophytocola sp. TaxID=1872138 RepID=UPI002ED4B025